MNVLNIKLNKILKNRNETTYYSIYMSVISSIYAFPQSYIQQNVVKKLQIQITTNTIPPPPGSVTILNDKYTFTCIIKLR
jgi:hypothetical protein